MDERKISDLSDRVDQVERAARVWRIAAVGAWAAIALVLCLRWIGPGRATRSIRATEILVVDANDRTLVRIGEDAEATGKATLEIRDVGGDRRVSIGLGESNAPHVALSDSNGACQLILETDRMGSAIAFRNLKSQSGLLLGADSTGIAAIRFMNGEGQRLAEMALGPDGSARLIFRSKDGRKLFEAP